MIQLWNRFMEERKHLRNTPTTATTAEPTPLEKYASITEFVEGIHVTGNQARTAKLRRIATNYLLL